MQRSDDGGVTWTDIGPGAIQDSGGEWWGVKAYDFASDGKMYVIAGTSGGFSAGNAIGIRIYRVTDPYTASPTFTLIYSNDETKGDPRGISCHPNDPDIVVALFTGGVSDITRFARTEDATAGTPCFTTTNGDTVFGNGPLILMDDDSYLIASSAGVRRSTDNGATTTNVQAYSGVNWASWNARGPYGTGKLFVGISSGLTLRRIYRTTDNGVTWTRILEKTTGSEIRNIFYDAVNDVIYTVTISTGATGRILQCPNASTVGADALTETDISGNLDTLGGNWGSASGSCAAGVQ